MGRRGRQATTPVSAVLQQAFARQEERSRNFRHKMLRFKATPAELRRVMKTSEHREDRQLAYGLLVQRNGRR